jgi:sugar lactone lactonase YvrE
MTKRLRWAAPALLLLLSIPRTAVAHPGTGIAVDRQGRVYFTDLKRIWRWEPGGRVIAIVEGKHSHAIRLDADGSLEGEHLAYDSATQRWLTSAWRLGPDGSLTDSGPKMEEGFPFLFTPAVASDGTRYYTRVDNNRRDVSEIHRRTPDGRLELLAGGAYGYADGVGREARFGPIGAVAVGPGGAIYVTDLACVRKVTADGRVTTLARGGGLLKPTLAARLLGMGERYGSMMGLCVDAGGNVFAANYGGRRVVRVSPSGGVTSVLEESGPWSPTGVALSGSELYVLESGTMPGPGLSVRVRRLTPGGKAAVLAVIRDGKREQP